MHRLSMKKTIYINGSCCLSKLTAVARLICCQLHLMVPVYRVIVTRVCMISKKNMKIIRDFFRSDKKLTNQISLLLNSRDCVRFPKTDCCREPGGRLPYNRRTGGWRMPVLQNGLRGYDFWASPSGSRWCFSFSSPLCPGF